MNVEYYFWPAGPFPWINCSGGNAKNTLVLSSDTELSGNLLFLKKILRAVDLDFDEDIHFLSTPANLQAQLMSSPEAGVYKKLLLFGLKPLQVGILSGETDGCQVFHFEKLTCVCAPALAEIERRPEQKKALWSALKTVFSTPNNDEA